MREFKAYLITDVEINGEASLALNAIAELFDVTLGYFLGADMCAILWPLITR